MLSVNLVKKSSSMVPASDSAISIATSITFLASALGSEASVSAIAYCSASRSWLRPTASFKVPIIGFDANLAYPLNEPSTPAFSYDWLTFVFLLL